MEPNKDKKLYLIMGILIILILIVLRSIITSGNDAVIDYNEISSGMDIALQGKQTENREIYYVMENILSKFAYSYTSSEEFDTNFEDYYQVLNKSYRNKIGKTKYTNLVNNLFNKITVTDSSGMGIYTSVQTKNVIRAIYEIKKDTYLCVIGLVDGTSYGYLGVKLMTDNNTYEIFYIE